MPPTDPAANPITRRRVVQTGARLAYAAPLVAATMQLRGGQVAADLDPATLCRCYDPALGFTWVNPGGACTTIPPTEPCGACHSCDPSAGAACPEGSTGIGSQIPECFDPTGELCTGVYRPVCSGFPMSPPGA
jgi:hypothetical protein